MNNAYVVSQPKKVKDLIKDRTRIYKILTTSRVCVAAKHIKNLQVRAIGVIDLQGNLVGLISQKDISDKVVAEGLDPFFLYVIHCMSTDLVSVREDTSVTECLELMLKRDINHLVVLSEDDEFMGLISRKDVDRACLEQLEEYATVLHDFVSRA